METGRVYDCLVLCLTTSDSMRSSKSLCCIDRPRFPVGLTGSLWKKSILGPSFKGCQDASEGSTPGAATGFPHPAHSILRLFERGSTPMDASAVFVPGPAWIAPFA